MYAQLLKVLALEIEKQLPAKAPVTKFTLVYTYDNTTVYFIINDDPEKVPLAEPSLANGIKMYLDSNINEPDFDIKYALIFWSENQASKIGVHFLHKTTGQKMESVKTFN